VLVQNKKFNGCEFIEMHGLDATDLGNRSVHNATNRFTSMHRFCEKFPWQSSAAARLHRVAVKRK
jgi:hypothetical protein